MAAPGRIASGVILKEWKSGSLSNKGSNKGGKTGTDERVNESSRAQAGN